MAADLDQNNVVDDTDYNLALANNGTVGMFYEHTVDFPDFYYIEEEIERSQDVVLLLEFWNETAPGIWDPIYDPYDLPGGASGHYVTVAGVNSSDWRLLISDPWWDAAEAGWPGEVHAPPHAPLHPTLHNDTLYASHDDYQILNWTSPPLPPNPYGVPMMELVGYLQQLGYPPWMHTFIRAAIITSPLAVEDVAVTNVTTIKDNCPPKPTVSRGYNVELNVTVENQGPGPATFNVTVYANMTTNGNMTQIGVGPCNLPSGSQTTLNFTWDTTGFAYGNYTIVAIASPLPTETDLADNTLASSRVLL